MSENAGMRPGYASADFPHAPLLVFYEATRACDLACSHCRACAIREPHPRELPHADSLALLDQLATFPRKPMVVVTGGDPMKRPDLRELIAHGTDLGLAMSLAPAATPRVTPHALDNLRAAGLTSVAISVDGVDAATHDAMRGVAGAFDQALRVIRLCVAAGLPVQVNTVVNATNLPQLDALADLLGTLGILRWSVFFLVPVGRGRRLPRLTPCDYDAAFAVLHRQAGRQPYAIKTTEAPFYRRYVLQHATAHAGQPPRHQTLATNDGKGVMFIAHNGDILPSGFFPRVCGRFPRDSAVAVYQGHPLFRLLRDSDALQGKCGACDFRTLCGGSRARSFALTGDPMAAEPDCDYLPPTWRSRQGENLACSA